MKPRFFSTRAAFRQWLLKNHQTATELAVGFYKIHTGKKSITWPQSVDEALCFGWIDGVRTSIDEHSYQIRFTPRKPGSIWSTVNIRKVQVLTEEGLMQPAGLDSFNKRKQLRTRLYAHEKEEVLLPQAFIKQFKTNKTAWKYFEGLAAGYRKSSVNWVMGAQQEATRIKRLQQLIIESESGINQFKDNKYRK